MATAFIVRHGAMRFLGEFQPQGPVEPERGQEVVVRTERGLEIGEVLCEADPRALAAITEPTGGQILRQLTSDDVSQMDRIRDTERREMEVCCDLIKERRLQMELVDVEHLYGGERLIFYYFLAEKRVDFANW